MIYKLKVTQQETRSCTVQGEHPDLPSGSKWFPFISDALTWLEKRGFYESKLFSAEVKSNHNISRKQRNKISIWMAVDLYEVTPNDAKSDYEAQTQLVLI